MTDKWLALDEAVELIMTTRGVPVGAAQATLIGACGSGEVRSRELNPEHGGDSWYFQIPAAHWKAPDAHIDLTTDEVLLAGQTYGRRIVYEDGGRDDEGREVLRASMGKVEISESDLRHWLKPRTKLKTISGTKSKAVGKRPRIKEYLKLHFPKGVPDPALCPRQALRADILKWDSKLDPLDEATLKTAIDEFNEG
jgi:hypothetical protein